ncbi:structural polyprotein [Anisopteromalus calandrae positive-strand RNA virus 1]|nr:structural polyprotein [Anisopteromalus calandrae positive-strand RNA virus 1]
MEVPPARVYTSADVDGNEHSVKSFLKREQLLAFTNGTAYKQNDLLYDFNIPTKLFNDMVKDKLKGFSSFTATAVIRLQVQSEPFMAGRLIMCHLPVPDLLGLRGDFSVSKVERMMLLNHVQMDISHETDVTLRIPFVSPYNCYDLIASRWDWGRLVVRWYGDYNVIGARSIQTMIYGHFEDIVLGHPTSGKFSEFRDVTEKLEFQMNTCPSDKEKSRLQTKEASPLSGLISGISDKVLPGSSGIVNSLSSILGFSKPADKNKTITVVNRPVANFGNVDSVDNSHLLSYSKYNESGQINDISGTKIDEMSFDYLKKIPQYFDYFTFDTNSKDLLKSYVITPSGTTLSPIKFGTNTNYNTFSVEQPLHLSYICSPCKYWAGSLVYTFKIVKTNYHSGRLAFAFSPFSNAPESINDTDYTYRIIVDIREKSEVSFTIPFVSQSPFKRIDPLVNIRKDKYSDFAFSSTGTLSVWALTSLKCKSEIVPSSIQILCEISAGDDFYTTAPIESHYYPFTIGDDPTSSDYKPQTHYNNAFHTYVQSPTEKLEPQGLFSTSNLSNKRSKAIESQPPSITLQDNPVNNLSKDINGESFISFREFIKRNNFIVKYFPKTEHDLVASNSKDSIHVNTTMYYKDYAITSGAKPISAYIRPPSIQLSNITGSTNDEASRSTSQVVLNSQNSPLSFVSAMYAFYHGGLRFKVATKDEVVIKASLLSRKFNDQSYSSGNQANLFPFIRTDLSYNLPSAYEQSSIKRVAEFAIPYYGLSLMASHWIDNETFYSSKPNNAIAFSSTPISDIHISVSASDDLNFKCFIGTPPCLGRSFFNSQHLDTNSNPVSNIYPHNSFVERDPFQQNYHFPPTDDPYYFKSIPRYTISNINAQNTSY